LLEIDGFVAVLEGDRVELPGQCDVERGDRLVHPDGGQLAEGQPGRAQRRLLRSCPAGWAEDSTVYVGAR
jgi:hypothetical protein